MGSTRLNSIAVLAGASIVLASAMIFAYACAEVVEVGWAIVAEIRQGRMEAAKQGQAIGKELKDLNEWANDAIKRLKVE